MYKICQKWIINSVKTLKIEIIKEERFLCEQVMKTISLHCLPNFVRGKITMNIKMYSQVALQAVETDGEGLQPW